MPCTCGSRPSVLAQILQYIEGGNTFNALNFQHCMSVYGPGSPNDTAMSQIISVYVCPSDPQTTKLSDDGYANYVACLGDTAAQQEIASGVASAVRFGKWRTKGTDLDRVGVSNEYSHNDRSIRPRRLCHPGLALSR